MIKNWLYRLYVRNGWLDIGRKRPIPHEAWMQVAGYFYYYGHYYAALSLEQLPKDGASRLSSDVGQVDVGPARKGRLLVGLSAVRLSPAVRHQLRADDAASLFAIVAVHSVVGFALLLPPTNRLRVAGFGPQSRPKQALQFRREFRQGLPLVIRGMTCAMSVVKSFLRQGCAVDACDLHCRMALR